MSLSEGAREYAQNRKRIFLKARELDEDELQEYFQSQTHERGRRYMEGVEKRMLLTTRGW